MLEQEKNLVLELVQENSIEFLVQDINLIYTGLAVCV